MNAEQHRHCLFGTDSYYDEGRRAETIGLSQSASCAFCGKSKVSQNHGSQLSDQRLKLTNVAFGMHPLSASNGPGSVSMLRRFTSCFFREVGGTRCRSCSFCWVINIASFATRYGRQQRLQRSRRRSALPAQIFGSFQKCLKGRLCASHEPFPQTRGERRSN